MKPSRSLKFFLFFLIALASGVMRAQQSAPASVHGVVTDPDDAVIPGAAITLTPTKGKAVTVQSGSDGGYTVKGLAPGTYIATATMTGFATFVREGVRVAPGQSLALDIKMALQVESQEVQVTAQNQQVSVDADSNASSTVIKGKDLDALSDDPDELSSELSALAGPAAGPSGGQIYVDGFTGGQLPPKSSIREIRINQNPFSSQYDKLGYGRVEHLEPVPRPIEHAAGLSHSLYDWQHQRPDQSIFVFHRGGIASRYSGQLNCEPWRLLR